MTTKMNSFQEALRSLDWLEENSDDQFINELSGEYLDKAGSVIRRALLIADRVMDEPTDEMTSKGMAVNKKSMQRAMEFWDQTGSTAFMMRNLYNANDTYKAMRDTMLGEINNDK